MARWRGPATGRVRIMSPYRARAARARVLFCAGLQEGEFPTSTPTRSPAVRGAPRADRQPRPAPRRPGRRGALPLPLVRLAAHRAPRSQLAELRRGRRGSGALAVHRRGLRPDRSGGRPTEAGGARPRPRALGDRRGRRVDPAAAGSRPGAGGLGWRPRGALAELGVDGAMAAQTLAPFAPLPDPDALPGPLQTPRVLAEFEARRVFSANSLEGWVTCSYKWFVDHELSPQRLDPARRSPVDRRRHPWRARAPVRRPSGRRTDPAARRRRPLAQPLRRAGRRVRHRLRRAHPPAAGRARARQDTGRCVSGGGGQQRDRVPARPRAARARFRRARPRARGRARPPARRSPSAMSSCAGESTASTSPRDGHSAIVRDYKTGKAVANADKFAERGTLQIQLYMLVGPAGARARPSRRPLPPARRHRPQVTARARARRSTMTASSRSISSAPTASRPRSSRSCSTKPRRSRSRQPPRCAPAGSAATRSNGECPRYCTYQADLPARARPRRRRRREQEAAPTQHERRRTALARRPRARAGRARDPGRPARGPSRPAEQADGDRRPRARRLPRGRRRHRQDQRARRPLLRRDHRRRRRSRPRPRLHLHRARRGRDAHAGSRRADAALAARARARRATSAPTSCCSSRGRPSAPG